MVFVDTLISENRVLVVRELEIVAEIDPLLLHELELPAEVGVQDHDDHTVIAFVGWMLLNQAVRKAPPQHSPPVRERARCVEGRIAERPLLRELERAARVRPPRVRAERASRAFEI